jgi:hypothetical protein
MRHHLCVAVVAFGLASCSRSEELRPVFPAGGKVLVDGQPVEGVVLTFLPVDLSPDGTTLEMIKARVDADGSYQVTTYSRPAYSPRSGLPAGEYVVLAQLGDDPSEDNGLKKKRQKDNALPEHYSDPKKTPLRATITGPTELPTFELTTLHTSERATKRR